MTQELSKALKNRADNKTVFTTYKNNYFNYNCNKY